MNWFSGAGKLLGKVNDIHERFIEIQTEFKLLRQQTESSGSATKEAVEKLAAKVESIQAEQTRTYAELKAEIRALELRMNTLSEKAFHAVAEKAAREILEARSKDFSNSRVLPPKSEE
jgi:cell division protein FtsB